ncbi:hypothetical protein B0T24DRAFT_678506 [Lasiosphaeria ovina]|uniref:WSC domain-containing protein n=1 Tax=Lasiosphaeria ovina TaxID=92902 RepID=A0AAE0KAT9_9PEZI|nr:hypothetical protein B0T24DRAFT_678506 [Lasiosphaeria ovina]
MLLRAALVAAMVAQVQGHTAVWAPGMFCRGGNNASVDDPDGLGGELHTQNQSRATGSAFAISYHADIADVTMENLVVFSVRHKRVCHLWQFGSGRAHVCFLRSIPWKRITTFDVADLPACPDGRCYCAWLGEPNMYMQNFKCHVTGATSTTLPGPAQPPVYCANNTSSCVSGPKQMIAWHQSSGNNVVAPGDVTPPYNAIMGFQDGAQTDIFASPTASPSTTAAVAATYRALNPNQHAPRLLRRLWPPASSAPSTDVSGPLTPKSCIAACSALGFASADVEFASECWCGSGASPPPAPALVADAECNMPCGAGGSSETCGAARRGGSRCSRRRLLIRLAWGRGLRRAIVSTMSRRAYYRILGRMRWSVGRRLRRWESD